MRKKYGFAWNTILKCSFMGIDCLNDLHWMWLPEFGNCWQFNAKLNLSNHKINLKQSKNTGKYYGLSIEIFPLYNENKYSTSVSTGMEIFVHNSSFKPKAVPLSLEVGKLSNIEIKRTFYQKSPSPYSECIDLDSYSSDLYDYMKSMNLAYRQEDCFFFCIQKSIINKCGCYETTTDNLKTLNIEPCFTRDQTECIQLQYLNFNLSECKSKSCPLECETVEYGLSISSQSYPARNYYENSLYNEINRNISRNILNKSLTLELMREHSLSFNIFYSHMGYTSLTESPKTSMADLFSQIGGGLGLFVSFSVFTLFEFIEILILIIHRIIISIRINKLC